MKFPFKLRLFPFSFFNSRRSQTNQTIKVSSTSWKALGVLCAISVIVLYTETMISIAIPDIIKEFNISYNTSSWILTIYLIVGGIMTPITGKLSDIFGRKKILIIVFTSYTIGVITAGFASDIYLLLIARALQGIGISFLPVAYGIIKDNFPPKRMAVAQSLFTSMFAFGSVLGIILGGPIIQYYGWNMTFILSAPISIAILIAVGRLSKKIERDYRDTAREKQSVESIPKSMIKSSHKNRIEWDAIKRFANIIDIKGAILLSIFITSFFLLLTSFESSNNNSAPDTYTDLSQLKQIILPTTAITSILLFIYVEMKNNNSHIIDLRLLANKVILIPNLLSFIVGFWIFVLFYTIPILAKSPPPIGLGITSVDTSFLLLPYGIVVLIFGPTSGYIISKLGSTKPVLIGTVVSSIGFTCFLLFHSVEISLVISLSIVAVGISLTTIGSINAVMLFTPKQFSGMSLAMTSLLKLIGSAIGPAMAAIFLQNFQYRAPINNVIEFLPSAQSYNLIFFSSLVISIISIALAVILRHFTDE